MCELIATYRFFTVYEYQTKVAILPDDNLPKVPTGDNASVTSHKTKINECQGHLNANVKPVQLLSYTYLLPSLP